MTKEQKRMVGYIRVSTKKQVDIGFSLKAQEKKLKQYADLYEIDLVGIIVDAGESAKTLKRKGVQKALKMLKDGEADGILVVKLDRLTRSPKDFGILLETYFSKKYSLVSVSEQLDTNSAAGRLAVNVLMVVSQWEREAIGERTSAALQYKKSKGEYTGGVIPYGFELHKNGVDLLRNEAEQKIIEKAKKLRNWEYSFGKISKILAKQGHLSRRNKPFNPKSIMLMIA